MQPECNAAIAAALVGVIDAGEEPQAASRVRREAQALRTAAIRLTPEEADRVRSTATSSGRSLAGYVLAIIDDRPAPSVDLSQVAQISSAVAVLAGIPGAIRDSKRTSVGSPAGCRILFTLNFARASLHRAEIHQTLDEISRMRKRERAKGDAETRADAKRDEFRSGIETASTGSRENSDFKAR